MEKLVSEEYVEEGDDPYFRNTLLKKCIEAFQNDSTKSERIDNNSGFMGGRGHINEAHFFDFSQKKQGLRVKIHLRESWSGSYPGAHEGSNDDYRLFYLEEDENSEEVNWVRERLTKIGLRKII